MTPAARLSAAIEVLDRILAGQAAEQALTNWGRGHRFAGSGDRAALRDLVFEALRCKRSFAALGGGETGRGLILGGLRAAGQDVAALFTGEGFAPAPPGPGEAGRIPIGAEALDCPDWLLAPLQASLGSETEAILLALRHRAPVFLRVNLARSSVAAAQAALAAEGIVAELHLLAKTALQVTGNERKIQNSATYLEGLVDLQDAASQAVVEALPLRPGLRVLDFCAGGGGKSLAMAALGAVVLAHDANPGRMADLPARAARAGARVTITDNPSRTAPYDLILTDVPCSGSGSWRRDPQGKWALTPARLAEIEALQAQILDRAATMVSARCCLAYATCSLLRSENEAQVTAFLARHPGWILERSHRFTPLQGGDGFFVALLTAPADRPTQL
jgi:16S rRNA (cytosine967-C5)-methyltransferase